jgi:aspartate-semialdehyde dehydrogenase
MDGLEFDIAPDESTRAGTAQPRFDGSVSLGQSGGMKPQRRNVAVVGATGIAGQQFLVALANHPWFRVTKVAASERSAGKTLAAALTDGSGHLRWYCDEPPPADLMSLQVEDARHLDPSAVDAVFTAVESDAARELEPLYAVKVPTISTASAFRYEPDVPIFIPGVNGDHHALIAVQRRERGWKGFVTPIPNCTTMGLAMTLAPLHRSFGVEAVVMTSLQAMSGAGRSPGVLGLDILDNVIPFISKEEEKVERETQKILGVIEGSTVRAATFPVSATCMRVAVRDGHTEAAYVQLRREASLEEVKSAMREFGAEFLAMRLPSSPPALIHIHEDPYRPQPRLDRDMHHGMTTVVGRLRKDGVLPRGVKYVLLSHNTKMGAARGAVLVAESLANEGYL